MESPLFLPIRDEPRDPSHMPWATVSLIFVNLFVFALTVIVAANGMIEPFFELVAFHSDFPTLTQAFTSMWVHSGVLHVLGNMLFLWVYGPNVERRLGPLGFLALYVGAGIIASLLFALVSVFGEAGVGASGAISGLLGTYLVFFPGNKIRFTFPLLPFFSWGIPAFLVLGWYLMQDIVWAWTGAETGIAHSAHLGGFFAGVGLALGLIAFERVTAVVEADAQRD